MPGEFLVLVIHIARDKGKLSTTVEFPNMGFRRDAEVRVKPPQLALTLRAADGAVDAAMELELDATVLAGSMRRLGKKSPCAFVRVVGLDADTMRRYAGEYAT